MVIACMKRTACQEIPYDCPCQQFFKHLLYNIMNNRGYNNDTQKSNEIRICQPVLQGIIVIEENLLYICKLYSYHFQVGQISVHS